MNAMAVATDTATEFDLGPLSWVQGEIDQALTRGLESLAAFARQSRRRARRSSTRARTSTRPRARSRWSGSTRSSPSPTRSSGSLSRLEELPPRRCAADVRRRRSRVPQARASSWTSSSTARRRCRSSSIPNTRRCSGRAASRPRRRPIFSIPICRRARRASRRARSMPPNRSPSYLVKQRRLYQRGLLAWLRGDDAGRGDDARRDRRHRGRHDAGAACARSGGPSARCSRRSSRTGSTRGFGVKQLAARIDLQIRRVVEGSAKVADRLRREVLYFVAISAPVGAAGAGGAARVQAVGPHSVGRGAVGRRRAPPAAAARGARAARRRQGCVAQGRVGSRREPAEAEADARVGARQGRGDRQRRADEAHRGAGRAPRQDAGGRRVRAGRDGIRDRAAAGRERVRELREPVAATSRSRSTRCWRGSTPRARAAPPPRRARRCSTRCASARRSACCSRRWAARSRPTCGTWSRCSTRSSATTRSAPSSRRSRKDSQQIRGALRMLGLDDADRLLELCQAADRDATPIPRRRSTTRISSCSPNRCRASASTSRPSSSSVPTATA